MKALRKLLGGAMGRGRTTTTDEKTGKTTTTKRYTFNKRGEQHSDDESDDGGMSEGEDEVVDEQAAAEASASSAAIQAALPDEDEGVRRMMGIAGLDRKARAVRNFNDGYTGRKAAIGSGARLAGRISVAGGEPSGSRSKGTDKPCKTFVEFK